VRRSVLNKKNPCVRELAGEGFGTANADVCNLPKSSQAPYPEPMFSLNKISGLNHRKIEQHLGRFDQQ
jgi:hypothetical protein